MSQSTAQQAKNDGSNATPKAPPKSIDLKIKTSASFVHDSTITDAVPSSTFSSSSSSRSSYSPFNVSAILEVPPQNDAASPLLLTTSDVLPNSNHHATLRLRNHGKSKSLDHIMFSSQPDSDEDDADDIEEEEEDGDDEDEQPLHVDEEEQDFNFDLDLDLQQEHEARSASQPPPAISNHEESKPKPVKLKARHFSISTFLRNEMEYLDVAATPGRYRRSRRLRAAVNNCTANDQNKPPALSLAAPTSIENKAQERVYSFFWLFFKMEKLLFFGFCICCDSFLIMITILPTRVFASDLSETVALH